MHALSYTLGVFALILLLARLKVPLAAAIAVGAVSMAFLFGQTVGQVARTVLAGVIQPRTIALAVITAQLMTLSALMQVTGQYDRIVSLAKALLRRPVVAMAALPALIGLLPMPGGALFSAPMVESVAGAGRSEGSFLSAVNYWFRHIWEYWWPLYPGVMLAMTLTESSYLPFAACQFPLGVFLILAGTLLFRRTPPELRVKGGPPPPGVKRKLFRATAPIWVIVLVWVSVKYAIVFLAWLRVRVPALGSFLPDLSRGLPPEAGRYFPLAVGLAASIVWLVVSGRVSRRSARSVFGRKIVYTMTVLVVSVMVFQYVLKEVGAADGIARELLALHVPVVVAVLPFIAGMVTGLAVGFVGTSLPIVLAVVGALPDHGSIRPWVALAYCFGHIGQMMSPLHLCQVVSNRYFKTTFGPMYRLMWPSAVLAAALGAAYFVILRMFM